MQLYFLCNGATVPVNVLADSKKPISEQFELKVGDTVTSLVSVSPKRCDAVVVTSTEPISVNIGGTVFPVGPEPLVWTRKANQGKPIADGDARVDITTTNAGEKDTLVNISAYH